MELWRAVKSSYGVMKLWRAAKSSYGVIESSEGVMEKKTKRKEIT